jgi:VWFA-related protein
MVVGLLASRLASPQVAPTFRSSTELVVVDLIAVDSRGRFIEDLRAGEIELRHGGKRQPVQLLQLIEAGPVAVAPRAPMARQEQPEAASDGPDRGSPEPRRDVRRVAVVIDKSSLSVDAVPRVREAIGAMLGEVPSDVPVLVALVDSGLTIVQDFTRDRRVLEAAIGRLTPNLDVAPGSGAVYNTVDRVCASRDATRVIEAALDAGEHMIRDAELRSANTAAGLITLANGLARVPGRKHLVLYSSGYAIEPVADAVDAFAAAVSSCTSIDAMTLRRRASEALGGLRSQAVANDMRRMIEAANRAQTSLYTLDPAGLSTTAIAPQFGSSRTSVQGPMPMPTALRHSGRDYLEGLSKETGGLNVRSNDLASVFRSAVQDALEYYLVGYYLPASDDKKGEAVRVSVSVKRKGVSVRYRRDYVAQGHAAPFTK